MQQDEIVDPEDRQARAAEEVAAWLLHNASFANEELASDREHRGRGPS